MMNREVSLTEENVIGILYNLLCATNFIHQVGVIHRDIKSANLLINSDGQIKLCDFGLSRCVPKKNDTYKRVK